MTNPSRGLSDVSTADLEALLRAVEQRRLDCPLTDAGLLAVGLGSRGANVLLALAGLDRIGVAAAVRIAIAERVHRPPPRLDLVWTGPEARSSSTRETAIVIRQLFEAAEQSVLVGGFRFDHGADLLRPLHHVMTTKSVQATFFLDIEGHAENPADADRYAVATVDRFFAENWPFGPPRPAVYYDPRTARRGPPWASLHAKCVVADERLTLIGSANFTRRGQEDNVEAGVLIEDDAFATLLVAQWRSLIDSAIMKRYAG